MAMELLTKFVTRKTEHPMKLSKEKMAPLTHAIFKDCEASTIKNLMKEDGRSLAKAIDDVALMVGNLMTQGPKVVVIVLASNRSLLNTKAAVGQSSYCKRKLKSRSYYCFGRHDCSNSVY